MSRSDGASGIRQEPNGQTQKGELFLWFFFNPKLHVIAYPHEPRGIRRFLTVGAVVLVDGFHRRLLTDNSNRVKPCTRVRAYV